MLGNNGTSSSELRDVTDVTNAEAFKAWMAAISQELELHIPGSHEVVIE